jgi:DNA polymerase V
VVHARWVAEHGKLRKTVAKIWHVVVWNEDGSECSIYIPARLQHQMLPGVVESLSEAAVRRHVGVPVCVGVARTKTLAKLANKWAKNNKAFAGVCHWDSVPSPEREALLGRLSVEEAWGIAGRLTRRLIVMAIFTIADLVRAGPVTIRDKFSVVMMRTALELQGTPCIPMEEERIGRDQLISSRSFAKPITTTAGIRQVMSVYGQQASARLAKHGLQAKVLTAFAGTSHFNPNDTSYPSVCVPLPMPTADPVILTKARLTLLPRIVEGVRYARAGIMVTDLRPTGNQIPLSLFENPHEERHIGTLLEDVTFGDKWRSFGDAILSPALPEQ